MFENGAVDLVYYFYTTCNQELSETLKKRSLETSPDGTAKKESPGEQVKDAIEIRLKMVVPYKDNWPQAIALMALPPNVPTSLKHLLTVVDDICYYAGDKSTDVSELFYTLFNCKINDFLKKHFAVYMVHEESCSCCHLQEHRIVHAPGQ